MATDAPGKNQTKTFTHTDRIKSQNYHNVLRSLNWMKNVMPCAMRFRGAKISKFSLFASGVRFPDQCKLPLKIKLVRHQVRLLFTDHLFSFPKWIGLLFLPRMNPIASIPATRSTVSLWNGLRRSLTQSATAWIKRKDSECTKCKSTQIKYAHSLYFYAV